MIVLSGVFISFPWAGEIRLDGLDELWAQAEQRVEGWQSISIPPGPLAAALDAFGEVKESPVSSRPTRRSSGSSRGRSRDLPDHPSAVQVTGIYHGMRSHTA